MAEVNAVRVTGSKVHGALGFFGAAVDHRRSRRRDTFLGIILAYVAGAANAGGFLAIGAYTSHMTGILSSLADNLVLGSRSLVVDGALAILAFVLGASASAMLINWGRRNKHGQQFAYPLAVEACCILAFGVAGTVLPEKAAAAWVLVPLLCFTMGLQNASITKISGARIRTTHMTGMVTDIGIELGKLVYSARLPAKDRDTTMRPDLAKLQLHMRIVGSFCVGGLTGALAFGHFGFLATVPLAAILFSLSLPRLIAVQS